MRKFGTTELDPYGGGHWYAEKVVFRILRFVFRTQPSAKIILDYWIEDSRERTSLVQKLREYGATRVVALYFVTPREIVNSWFWLKPGIAKIEERGSYNGEKIVYFSSNAPSHDYDVFHELAKNIDADGFDEVIRVDPRPEPILLD